MNAMNPANTGDVPQIGIHDQKLLELTVDNFVRVVRRAGKTLVPLRVGTAHQSIDR